ncbi:hypothetical protein AB5J52_48070 (plasmid) [Streptomyces sp. R39]|uniref:Uncharacterized protein n=1 Tax=Streptomyces sp. R39 TaxID=3238631 RepID=A0AB39R579_9ACTN
MPDVTRLPDPFDTASQAFKALLDVLGPGRHQLTCSAQTLLGSYASATTSVEGGPDDQFRAQPDPEGWLMFCHLLAQTSIAFRHAAVFTRTYITDSTSVVRGWSVIDGWPHPMGAADVFAAHCSDLASGDPIPPEPGTDYQAGALLTAASHDASQ